MVICKMVICKTYSQKDGFAVNIFHVGNLVYHYKILNYCCDTARNLFEDVIKIKNVLVYFRKEISNCDKELNDFAYYYYLEKYKNCHQHASLKFSVHCQHLCFYFNEDFVDVQKLKKYLKMKDPEATNSTQPVPNP